MRNERRIRGESLKRYDDLVAQIRLTLHGLPGIVVLVEGQEDVEALKSTIPRERMFPMENKPQVLSAAESLRASGEGRFIAVFDRDFDPLPADPDENYLPYPERDLESTILTLGVGQEILRTRGTAQKLKRHGGADAVMETIYTALDPISQLRALNAKFSWGIPFSDINFEKCVDSNSMEIDRVKLCRLAQVTKQAHDATLDPKSIRALPTVPLVEFIEHSASQRPHGGKDVAMFLGIALRKHAGSLKKNEATPESILSTIHVAGRYALPGSPWGRHLRELVDNTRSEDIRTSCVHSQPSF